MCEDFSNGRQRVSLVCVGRDCANFWKFGIQISRDGVEAADGHGAEFLDDRRHEALRGIFNYFKPQASCAADIVRAEIGLERQNRANLVVVQLATSRTSSTHPARRASS